MQPFEPTDRSRQIGRRLKKLRRLSGMTQMEAIAASGLDMTDSTLSRLELGHRLARDGELFSLAKAYGVTLQHITKQNSNVDREDFKIGDDWHGAKTQPQLPLNIPKPGPHMVGQVASKPPAPGVLRAATHAVLTSIPAGLPPQPSASTLLTPAQYMERVYVPSLERRVADLTAQLEEANRLLRANGHREVVNS